MEERILAFITGKPLVTQPCEKDLLQALFDVAEEVVQLGTEKMGFKFSKVVDGELWLMHEDKSYTVINPKDQTVFGSNSEGLKSDSNIGLPEAMVKGVIDNLEKMVKAAK